MEKIYQYIDEHRDEYIFFMEDIFMKKKLFALLSLVLAVVFVFTACERRSGDGGTAVKDSIIIQIVSEWSNLDPAVVNDLMGLSVVSQFFDGLLLVDKDNNLSPGLATRWEVSSDGLVYTFFLREGVTFHNGDPLTADDVVFSFERSRLSPATSRVTGTMARTEKVDDMTVRVTLQHAYAPFLACLAQANLGVVSQRAVEEMGQAVFTRNPVGTGPYMFVEWRPGDRLIMQAFPDYWRGPAPITHAEYRIISDLMTATIALESGEVDMIYSVNETQIETVRRNPNLAFNTTPSTAKWFIGFNTQQGLFADNPVLREVVGYAVNRDDVIMGALEGIGTPLYAATTPGIFGFPEGFVTDRTHNPARARQLLEESGFLGQTITLRTMESALYALPAAVMQEQLRVAGFDARLDLMERGAFLADVLTAGQYEIKFTAVNALVPDADFHMFTRYHSQFMGNGVNTVYLNVPEVDRMLEAARFSLDPQVRVQLYRELTDLIVNKHMAIVPMYANMSSTAGPVSLKGLYANSNQRYFIYDFSW